jgi:excisionase family DNA binding protein
VTVHDRTKFAVMADVPRIAWTVREFAASIGVNYETALAMVHDATVGHFKVGCEYRIPHDEVVRLVDEARKQAAAEREARAAS